MPTESTFLLAGLFVLLAIAGWALGRFGERDETETAPPLNIDYLKGLNFLLNEQTDQALEHFLKMVRVDDKTIETHFALGSLFRRRGEVDRAIRIHQNIIARPDLASDQRDQALYSLARDYQAAGLLDRAEKLFSRLAQGSRYQVQALENLCRIYEQEKEWEKAIEAGQQLEQIGGRSLALQIAHYYCELAEAASAVKDYAAARGHVKNAQTGGRRRTLRGALTRAHIARDMDDKATALKLYHRIIDEHTYLIAETLPEIVAIYRSEDKLGELNDAIEKMIADDPAMSPLVAYTAIVNNIGGIPVIDAAVEQYVMNEPTLATFVDIEALQGAGADKDEVLRRIRKALSKLAGASPRYQCQECGFSSQRLLWQCPSCRSWETQRPASRVQFDTVLQHSIT